MQLFEYAVIHKPTTKEKDSKEKATVIVPVTTVLASSAAEVTLQAARKIPEAFAEKLSECEVAVRPF